MVKTKILMIILLCVLVFFSTHLLAQEQVAKTRGVWLWGSTLAAEGSADVINKLKENYVNKVFLLVKGGAGTKISETLLKNFIGAAHAENIEIHLWYIVAEDGEYLKANPEAHIYHAPKPDTSAVPYPMNDSKVNLLYPGYKEYVLENIKYFLEKFDCDGIHLDVIRYTNLVYSFDKDHLQKAEALRCNTERLLKLFNDDYKYYSDKGFINLYANGDNDVVKWVTMRKNIIYDYVRSIRKLILSIKPKVQLNAAFMPEGVVDSNFADVHYSQDYKLNSPLLDEISPMAYYKSYKESTEWLKTVSESAVRKVNSHCKISAGFQTFDNVTPQEVKEEIQNAIDGNAYGIVSFRYGTTSDEQWSVIKEAFKKIYEAEK